MSTVISWKKIDNMAKDNSSPSMADLSSFSDLTLLKQDGFETIDFATTCELNQTFLDDTQIQFPNDVQEFLFGLWSNSISDKDGNFVNPPSLSIIFSESVTSSGITLDFWEASNDYCNNVTIYWYGVGGVLLSQKTFTINNYKYFCSNAIENYLSLVIKFNKTANPERFVKLSGIYFGEDISLQGRNIIDGTILEEIGITSEKLYSNELNCRIVNLDDDFNFVSNPGMFASIQNNQSLDVYINEKYYGRYYINNSKINDNMLSIGAFDLLGILESKEFKGGIWTDGTTFETILNQIILEANISTLFDNGETGFDVPAEILNKQIKGFIPITNCREALHQLCYATSVVANCFRSHLIKVREIDNILKDDIERNRVVLGTFHVEDNQQYTGISLNKFDYFQDSEDQLETIVNQDYAIGTYTIINNNPMYGYILSSSTGITLDILNANYIQFTVTGTTRIVKIRAKKYNPTMEVVTVTNPNYISNNQKIKQMNDCKLVSSSNAIEVATNQMNYYLRKFKVKSDIIFTDVDIADKVYVKDVSGNIIQMQTDLFKEDIVSMEVVGNAKPN